MIQRVPPPRFSARLPGRLEPNALATALARRRARDCSSGARLLDLTQSNPTAAALAYPDAAILAAFSDPALLRYEPDPAGHPAAREAVAAFARARGTSVDAGQVLLTSGTSEAYAYLFKLLADPGDEILVPRPSYPLFDLLAELEGLRTVGWPLRWSAAAGWRCDLDELARAITPRSRIVVVIHPDNPTGSFLKRDEAEGLVALCRERGIALVSDEVFADYAFAPDPRRAGSLVAYEDVPVFALGGLSKSAGLPQIKLSWILLGGPPDVRGPVRERLELIADTWLSVSTAAQVAAPRLLDAAPAIAGVIRDRTARNLERLRAACARSTACRLVEPEGGWYALLRLPVGSEEQEIVLALLERDVVVQPGWFYDFEEEGWLVLSLLPPEAEFAEGVERLLGCLEGRP